YHLEQCEPIPGIPASRIGWGKAVQGTARELLTDPDAPECEQEETSAKDVAIDFLVEILKDGSAPSKYVETEAKAAGVSWATVRRAADAIGVKKRKLNDAWYWFKPNLLNQVAQDAQPLNVEQVEQVDEQVAQNTEVL
ncbi:MAG: AAA family ATPase, partial [Acidovorax sp.]|nr:AAA family ATPase [Acidovorax sp.]